MWINEANQMLDVLKVTPSSLGEDEKISGLEFRESDSQKCDNAASSAENTCVTAQERFMEYPVQDYCDIEDKTTFQNNEYEDQHAVEDIFQCGRCKLQFQHLSEFINHKKYQCLSKESIEKCQKNYNITIPHENINISNNLPKTQNQEDKSNSQYEESSGENLMVSFLMNNSGVVYSNPLNFSGFPNQVILTHHPQMYYNGIAMIRNPVDMSQPMIVTPTYQNNPFGVDNSTESYDPINSLLDAQVDENKVIYTDVNNEIIKVSSDACDNETNVYEEEAETGEVEEEQVALREDIQNKEMIAGNEEKNHFILSAEDDDNEEDYDNHGVEVATEEFEDNLVVTSNEAQKQMILTNTISPNQVVVTENTEFNSSNEETAESDELFSTQETTNEIPFAMDQTNQAVCSFDSETVVNIEENENETFYSIDGSLQQPILTSEEAQPTFLSMEDAAQPTVFSVENEAQSAILSTQYAVHPTIFSIEETESVYTTNNTTSPTIYSFGNSAQSNIRTAENVERSSIFGISDSVQPAVFPSVNVEQPTYLSTEYIKDQPVAARENEETYECSDQSLNTLKQSQLSNCTQNSVEDKSVGLNASSVALGSVAKKSGPQFACSYCGKRFLKPFNLHQHERIHTRERPFQCIVCGRAFTQKSNVMKHMTRHKVWPTHRQTLVMPSDKNGDSATLLDQNSYTCQYCSKSFSTYKLHKQHLSIHSEYKVYRCIQRDCGETFKELDDFLFHSQTHKKVEFLCHVCLKSFNSLEDLGLHQYDHDTTKKKEIEKVLKCEICHSKFKTVAALINHKAVDTHKYKCVKCDAVFSSERFLRRHLSTHVDLSQCKFKCSNCNKLFKTEKSLTNHKFVHVEEKPFTCNYCQKQFAAKYRLQRHMALHFNFHFECPFKYHLGCNKTFYRNDKLRDHIATHTRCRSRSCRFCSKSAFPGKAGRFTSKENKAEEYKTMLKCSKCSQTFRKAKQWGQHHCTVSDRSFRSRSRSALSEEDKDSETVSNIEIIMVPSYDPQNLNNIKDLT